MIQLDGIRLRRGARVILDAASLSLHPGEKVALVGRNGAGKSSLFALLTGRLHEDQGEWSMPKTWRISEVLQTMSDEPLSATEFVLQGDQELSSAKMQLREAEASGDGMAMAAAHARLLEAGANDAPARAQSLISGLGFARDQWDMPVTQFSGGWRMRLQLARALMSPCEVLLLDEPTNHLDMDALVWLEDWLIRFPGLLLVISHDKRFLDTVTKVTVHIRQGNLTRYGGSYSTFEELLATQLSQQQIAHERQQQQLARLQSFVDRFKAKATKARQAQSRVKAMERMVRVAPVLADADCILGFETPPTLPNPMFSIQSGTVGYRDEMEHAVPVLSQVQIEVFAGERIGILGANGQGKSTSVNSIQGTLALLEGDIHWGKGLRMGYFAQQEMDLLDAKDTPLSHGLRVKGANDQAPTEQVWRDFLGGFGFGAELVKQPIDTLSGGEKARLLLASLIFTRPNLLVLDEPTNHLDMGMREALAAALNGFEGTVLLVSHDRGLLESVCDAFWWVKEGRVSVYDGELSDYERELLAQARLRTQGAMSNHSKPGPSDATAPSSSGKFIRQQQAQARSALLAQIRPLKRECQVLEERLSDMESQRQALHLAMADPQAQQSGGQEWARMGQALKELDEGIEAAENRWLELQTQLQELSPTEGQVQ